MWDCLVFTQYSYYHEFFCWGCASRLRNCHRHVWLCYIDTTKIMVGCMSSLIFSIDLKWCCCFIMFYFKLTNGEMVKRWMVKCFNSEIRIRIGHFFLTNIESVHFFYFKHSIFATDKATHKFKFLITNNKYSNQVYVIKKSDHWKTRLYQGSADHREGDCDSDLNCLASAISSNPLL